MNIGKIVEISGPVVDVFFENGPLPKIKEALKNRNNDLDITPAIELDLKRRELLTDTEQKKAKQDAIMQKEQSAAQLKQKYFGPEGELYKKRTALMTPIQDEIYNAVKDIADLRGYQLVLDRASDSGIIFGSPRIDISDEVLNKLGYK